MSAMDSSHIKTDTDSLINSEVVVDLQQKYKNRGAIISLAGPDGAGKSTLSCQLKTVIEDAGLPVEQIHCYQWYKNVFLMPRRLSILRSNKTIVILDRSIIDNVLEISRKMRLPVKFVHTLLQLTMTFYIKFDNLFILTAPLQELIKRRPEEPKSKVEHQLKIYNGMSKFPGVQALSSDSSTFQNAIEVVASVGKRAPQASTM